MGNSEFSLKHDIHCHSVLSACCHDPECTPDAIFAQARDMGYDTLCLTDHLWDADVPGASEWYAPQDIAHVLSSRPAAKADGLRCLVGCETEYTGGGRLGLRRDHFDLFDFVVIPPNHMHMLGFVRPDGVTTPAQMAELFTCRLEEISALDIPLEKIGIAHMTCPLLYKEGRVSDVIRLMDETRLMKVFDRLARGGAGIELNAAAFGELSETPDDCLRLYRLAKKAGCKFYCSSDAHRLDRYINVARNLPPVVQALELSAADRYIIPR